MIAACAQAGFGALGDIGTHLIDLVRWWLGELAVGRTALYLGFAVFVWLSCWSNIWAYFLNGIGEVRVQMYSALAAAGLNINQFDAQGIGAARCFRKSSWSSRARP